MCFEGCIGVREVERTRHTGQGDPPGGVKRHMGSSVRQRQQLMFGERLSIAAATFG